MHCFNKGFKKSFSLILRDTAEFNVLSLENTCTAVDGTKKVNNIQRLSHRDLPIDAAFPIEFLRLFFVPLCIAALICVSLGNSWSSA